jgi:hypothetical protein
VAITDNGVPSCGVADDIGRRVVGPGRIDQRATAGRLTRGSARAEVKGSWPNITRGAIAGSLL